MIEFSQGQPEAFTYAHAAGEVVRNLGYAVASAYTFYYFLEERPAKERKRTAYLRNIDTLRRLSLSGSRLLESLLMAANWPLKQDVETDPDARRLIKQLPGTNDVWPVTLSPFNTLFRACERIEKEIRHLGHDEQHMDDGVRHALRELSKLRTLFETDITVESIILARGQAPLVEQPRTLDGYEPMFMEVVALSRELAGALAQAVDDEFKPAFNRVLKGPILSASDMAPPNPARPS